MILHFISGPAIGNVIVNLLPPGALLVTPWDLVNDYAKLNVMNGNVG